MLALFLALASAVLRWRRTAPLYRTQLVGLAHGVPDPAMGGVRRASRRSWSPWSRSSSRCGGAAAWRCRSWRWCSSAAAFAMPVVEAAAGGARAAHPRHHDRHGAARRGSSASSPLRAGAPNPVDVRRARSSPRNSARAIRICSRCRCRCRRIRRSTRRWPRRARWAGRSSRRIRRRDASRRPTRRSGSDSRTTWWCGWPPAPNGSRVDVRSLSRVGLSDVGTNAARIRKYLAALEDCALTAARPRCPP